MFAPAAASLCAIARPIPRDAPVTSATFPARGPDMDGSDAFAVRAPGYDPGVGGAWRIIVDYRLLRSLEQCLRRSVRTVSAPRARRAGPESIAAPRGTSAS